MLKKTLKRLVPLFLLTLSACATVPAGPSVMVVPAPGKPFELFKQEDVSCRRWAEQQIGLSPQDIVNKNTATGAVAGTAIGAGFGALIGAASGNPGAGAAIGGAGGLLVGASSGASSGQMYGREAQRRYDYSYLQCMYANGNQIPGSNRWQRRSYRTRTILPPPPPQLNRSPVPPPPAGARPQIPPDMIDNSGEMQ